MTIEQLATNVIKQLINRYGVDGWDTNPPMTELNYTEQNNFNEEKMKLLVETLLTDNRYYGNPVIAKILSEKNNDDNLEKSVEKLLMVIRDIDTNAGLISWRYNEIEGGFPWADDGMNLIDEILNPIV